MGEKLTVRAAEPGETTLLEATTEGWLYTGPLPELPREEQGIGGGTGQSQMFGSQMCDSPIGKLLLCLASRSRA